MYMPLYFIFGAASLYKVRKESCVKWEIYCFRKKDEMWQKDSLIIKYQRIFARHDTHFTIQFVIAKNLHTRESWEVPIMNKIIARNSSIYKFLSFLLTQINYNFDMELWPVSCNTLVIDVPTKRLYWFFNFITCHSLNTLPK